jgi:hypothetical protein
MDYRMLVVVPVAAGALLAVIFDAVTDLSGAQERIAWFADRLGIRLAEADLVPSGSAAGAGRSRAAGAKLVTTP